jgi:dihydrofolate reductase
MKRLRYNVATSLDGFIARHDGAYDWIVTDTSIDFAALYREFDTLIMGRRTYDLVRSQGDANPVKSMKTFVVSRTLRPEEHPAITVLSDRVVEQVARLKEERGKDIWLFGGGELFRTLLEAGLVDGIELALMPVLIGEGIPVLAGAGDSPPLALSSCRTLPSGIVMLSYEVRPKR